MFIDELPETLRDQPGETVEERWNNLMDELQFQARADAGVCLLPWTEYDERKHGHLGVSENRASGDSQISLEDF